MDITKLKKEVDKESVSQEIKSLKDIKTETKKEDIKYEKRVKTLKVSYMFDDGEKVCSLTSKVMDHEGRTRYERVLSRLSEGMNFDTMPVEVRNRHFCMARLVCQCIEPEEWLLKAAGEDLEFLFHIAGRLLDHEASYFRNYSAEDEGGKVQSRFSIS